MFPHKETHFFSLYYERGIDWYLSKFNPSAAVKAVGEGSPTYSDGRNEVVRRVAEHLPHAKLIYIVRHPIRRIESDFVQLLDNGQQFKSFDAAIKTWRPLVESSCYWARINEFRKYFVDDQILVLFMEDLVSDPNSVLRRCFSFLDVDPDFTIDQAETSLNSRSTKRVDYPWMAWLRQQKIFLDAKWLMPTWVIQNFKPLLRKPLVVDFEWNEATRQEVIGLLREDIKTFLDFYGKPEKYWELS